MIVALDHGRTVGCAWGPVTLDRPHTTSWKVPAGRDGVTRWSEHRTALTGILSRYCGVCDQTRPCWGARARCERGEAAGSPLVIYEAPMAHNRGVVARVHMGLAAVTEMVATDLGAEVFEEAAATVRKAVLGKGSFKRPLRAAGR